MFLFALLGLPLEEVWRKVRLTPERLQDPDEAIPVDCVLELWTQAARVANDDVFGLHAQELACSKELDRGPFNVVTYIARCCKDLGAVIDYAERLNPLLNAGICDVSVHRGDGATSVRVDVPGIVAGTADLVDFFLSGALFFARDLTPTRVRPERVRLRRNAPKNPFEHERILGCPVLFGQPVNDYTFSNASLSIPIASADEKLLSLLDAYSENLIRQLPAEGDLVNRIRRELVKALPAGEIDIATVAERLIMTERTLQRRLEDEGLVFRDLVDSIRRELAFEYLTNPTLTLSQVSFFVGFSEPSAFHRAFKRWTNETVSDWRAARRDGA